MSNISGPDPAVIEAIERGNQVVFFDVAMGDADDKESSVTLGRIKLELFVQDVSFGDMVVFYSMCSMFFLSLTWQVLKHIHAYKLIFAIFASIYN